METKRTRQDLIMLQALPLEIKLLKTRQRIREWVNEYGEDGVYVSFSGGKDSTVLLHIVREMYPSVEAVFVNTGLEYPEIQQFVKSFDNVTILRPLMRFDEVIKKYGYPVISKEVSQIVMEARKNKITGKYTYRLKKLNGDALDKNGNLSQYNIPKYKPLLDVNFEISHKCCDMMKKKPSKEYEKTTGKKPIIATMAIESKLRTEGWLKNGCNAFEKNRQTSQPMSFWTEQDVLRYIKENNIKIASVYGEIEYVSEPEQMRWGEIDPAFAVLENQKSDRLQTTGCYRTGCIFCGFGCHLEKGESRFERLKRTHPRQYEYCIGGGEYDKTGIWKPNKEGLGMGHVFDELNKIYGDGFIRY